MESLPVLPNLSILNYFKNDSAYISNKTDTTTHLALQNLAKTFDVKIRKEKRWATFWTLAVYNNKLFQSHVATTDSVETRNMMRNFYGKRETIKVSNITSKYLSRLLQRNFNINVNTRLMNIIYFP